LAPYQWNTKEIIHFCLKKEQQKSVAEGFLKKFALKV
jgi:hypothetical protein